MKQLQVHWLLSNVFNTCINLTLTLEVEVGQVIDVFDVLDAFHVELFIFQDNIQVEVIKVIKPFLQFLQAYDSN
jgi:hypothetical protein